MAEKVILSEITREFTYDSSFGVFASSDLNPLYSLEAGQEYKVVWDGAEHTRTAFSFVSGAECVGLGNPLAAGQESNEDLFCIVYDKTNNYIHYLSLEQTASHRIVIYQIIPEDIDYLIKKSTLTAIADSIRAKTGGTDPIKVSDMAATIGGITGGGSGGSSEDVRYVTFMSYDGTIEYGKKAVAVGDDCADPIVRGIFDTPTRESDVQFNFTHDYWATEPNGATDPNALKAVTEDRVVYATYISVLRSYTITFYDGDTVLDSKEWAYGVTPSITDPAKSGFSFDGWEPAITTVTGNATYTAKWVEAITFAGGAWEDIIRIAEAGEAQKYFALGDTKSFSFTAPDGTAVTTEIAIAGFDKDVLADGSGTAPITIVVCGATYKQAHTESSEDIYSWETSAVRESLNDTVYSSFPESLKNAIKNVTKVSRKYIDGTSLTGILTTTEKVWIPSAYEMGSTTSYSGYGYYPETESEGAVRYSLAAGTVANNIRTSSGQEIYISFRSAHATTKQKALYHLSNGTLTQHKGGYANTNAYIIFGFCI